MSNRESQKGNREAKKVTIATGYTMGTAVWNYVWSQSDQAFSPGMKGKNIF